MSVTITISDNGHVEAKHNSGDILWSVAFEEYARNDDFDTALANWIGESMWQYRGDFS